LKKIEVENLVIGRGYELSDILFKEFQTISFPTTSELNDNVSFKNSNGIDVVLDDGEWFFTWDDKKLYVAPSSAPYYVIQNRMSALFAALLYTLKTGVKLKSIDEKFWSSIPGVGRRFECIGNYKGIELIDDYGHHPSEISAVIERARLKYGEFAILFQPHRISRFTQFFKEFKEALEKAPRIILLPVFTAGENIHGKESRDLYEELLGEGFNVDYHETIEFAGRYLKENLAQYNVKALISVGAGDLNKVFKWLKYEV